ncbi:MAG: putative quinol monooxygenase [Acidimicrobiia bacterium]
MLMAIVASQGGKPVEHIQVTVTFPKITPDNLDEFKRLAGEALKIAADEPGVLQYDWFFNADETGCVVRETVESSDAVLIHLGRVGDILGPVVQLGGGIEIELFGGSPSTQVVEALNAFSPTYYSYFQGK